MYDIDVPNTKRQSALKPSKKGPLSSTREVGTAAESAEFKTKGKRRQRALFGRPEDMEAETEAANALKARKDREKKKPRTTKSIIRDVKAKEARVAKAKQKDEAKRAVGEVRGGKSEEKWKMGKTLTGIMREMQLIENTGTSAAGSWAPSSTTTCMHTAALTDPAAGEGPLEPAINISEGNRKLLGVLVRPTARALRLKREMTNRLNVSESQRRAEASGDDPNRRMTTMLRCVEAGGTDAIQPGVAFSSPESGHGLQAATVQGRRAVFGVQCSGQRHFLDLTTELRHIIISLAVTETKYFVDPLAPTGAEQPDDMPPAPSRDAAHILWHQHLRDRG